jgi:polyisoprenoid-binding protein YceI
MVRFAPYLLAMTLLACGAPTQPAPERAPAEAVVAHTAPAGAYTLDKPHGSLIVRVTHMAYSNFTARFTTWDASLNFNPAVPENSSISVTIDPRSITSDNAPAGFVDVMRNDFLQAPAHPEITFRSTRVERTGPNTANITGDLTLLGVTKPVTLEARFNGGYEGMPVYDPNGRIGLSAHGSFDRSEFGMTYGLPPEGSNLGVGDRVELVIETEFTGPPLATPAPATP